MNQITRKQGSKEYDAHIGDVIIEHIRIGNTIRQAIRQLEEKLPLNRGYISNRWYQVIRQQRLNEYHEAETIRKKRYVTSRGHEWKKEEDGRIVDVILTHIANGGTQVDAIEYLSEELPYSYDVIKNRWQSRLRIRERESLQRAKERGKEKAEIKRIKKKIEEHQREIEQLVVMLEDYDVT